MSPKDKLSLRGKKRKRASRLRPKSQRPKDPGVQKGNGVLFPSTRVPKGMNKKTAKKLKKATRYKY
ncbi:MAG: hypothetical protein JSW11_19385 [Candidatus Heimdallarchaeota archaeon]|nr:MAG: hypothetical protein JSW11_19385 [Candidatus Heimdallarchaeota archaeon]